MKRRTLLSLSVCIWSAGALAGFCAGAQVPRMGLDVAHDFLLTKTDAFALRSPQMVCPANATRLLWSNDSNLLLVARVDASDMEDFAVSQFKANPTTTVPTAKQSVIFYNRKSQRVRSTVSLPPDTVRIDDAGWLGVSSSAYLATTHAPLSETGGNAAPAVYFSVDLISADGKSTSIYRSSAPCRTLASPTRPAVLLVERQENTDKTRVRMVGATGQEMASVMLPTVFTRDLFWGTDGKVYSENGFIETKNHETTPRILRLDFDKAVFEPAAGLPDRGEAASAKGKLALVPLDSVLNPQLPGERIHSLLLLPVGQEPSSDTLAVVSTDASSGALAPNGTAVAYISRGLAMMRVLDPVDRVAVLSARLAEKRLALVNQAQQIGQALMVFSSDNEDVVPASGVDWRQSLVPYVRNKSVFDGFVYQFGGGSLSGLKDRPGTILGFLPGPGGRAVVYADGHTKWESAP